MQPTHFLLDLDGVLADFFSSALHKITNVPEKEIDALTKSYVNNGNGFDMAKAFGLTPTSFWRIIDTKDFWENLNPFPHAKDLFSLLKRIYKLPIYISSSPSLNPYCIPQKIAWVYKHIGLTQPYCMFGSAKHLLAKPGAVLIDDLPKNCKAFTDAGGTAICVPSNWNTYPLTLEHIWSTIQEKLKQ